jgi:hypothetical protein
MAASLTAERATECHTCTSDSCPDTGSYYVSATDAGTVWLMAGPYQTHCDALAQVDHALKLADKHDNSGRAWFMGWGTVRMKDGTNRAGRLQRAGLMEAGSQTAGKRGSV